MQSYLLLLQRRLDPHEHGLFPLEAFVLVLLELLLWAHHSGPGRSSHKLQFGLQHRSFSLFQNVQLVLECC
jgi:hypothetical protein